MSSDRPEGGLWTPFAAAEFAVSSTDKRSRGIRGGPGSSREFEIPLSVPELYSIRLTDLAEAHLNSLAAYARRMIVDNLEIHLSHEPTRQSRRLKPMRPNPVAA